MCDYQCLFWKIITFFIPKENEIYHLKYLQTNLVVLGTCKKETDITIENKIDSVPDLPERVLLIDAKLYAWKYRL